MMNKKWRALSTQRQCQNKFLSFIHSSIHSTDEMPFATNLYLILHSAPVNSHHEYSFAF